MRQDIRGVILTIWLTILGGTLSTTFVLDYFASYRPENPKPLDLAEASSMIAGLWAAGLLAGILVILAGWYDKTPSSGISTVLTGYWVGCGIRLVLMQELQPFLRHADSDFDWFWGLVTLRGLPSYSLFVLLILVGGGLVVVLTVLLIHAFRERVQFDDLLPMLVEPRILWSVTALSITSMLIAIVFRNLLGELVKELDRPVWLIDALIIQGVSGSQFTFTKWLTLPQTNMILAAVLGFLVGGAYLCISRWSSAVTLFLAVVVHVMVMLLLDSSRLLSDPLYAGWDANRVDWISYLFFWLGTPMIGGIAAFALHNLRDAFQLPATKPVHQSE